MLERQSNHFKISYHRGTSADLEGPKRLFKGFAFTKYDSFEPRLTDMSMNQRETPPTRGSFDYNFEKQRFGCLNQQLEKSVHFEAAGSCRFIRPIASGLNPFRN